MGLNAAVTQAGEAYRESIDAAMHDMNAGIGFWRERWVRSCR